MRIWFLSHIFNFRLIKSYCVFLKWCVHSYLLTWKSVIIYRNKMIRDDMFSFHHAAHQGEKPVIKWRTWMMSTRLHIFFSVQNVISFGICTTSENRPTFHLLKKIYWRSFVPLPPRVFYISTLKNGRRPFIKIIFHYYLKHGVTENVTKTVAVPSSTVSSAYIKYSNEADTQISSYKILFD